MTQREQTWRVRCPCDYEEQFASETVAKAEQARHDETCPNSPEIEEVE